MMQAAPLLNIDFHNHLMPAVDDGAEDLDASRAGIDALREHGVGGIITTPHFDASLTKDAAAAEARLHQLDTAWAALKRVADAEYPQVRLERGAEVMLDVPDPVVDDPRLRLAGTRFVLVEFPQMSIPPRAEEVLGHLVGEGWRPILAHPERYRHVEERMSACEAWRRAGALLQVNAGSITGRYGTAAQRVAWRILESGWASYVGSDYHARGEPQLTAARDMLLDRGAEEQVQFLFASNPERLLTDHLPWPVAPIQPVRDGFLRRLRRLIR